MNSNNSLDFSELEECLKNLNDLQKSIEDDLTRKKDKPNGSVLSSKSTEVSESIKSDSLQEPRPSSCNSTCTDLDELIKEMKIQEESKTPPTVKLRKNTSQGAVKYRHMLTNVNNSGDYQSVKQLKMSASLNNGNRDSADTTGIARWRSMSHSMMINDGSNPISHYHTGSLPRVYIDDDKKHPTIVYKTSSQTNLSRPDSDYKTPIKIHQADKTTKTILIDEYTTAAEICQCLIARNFMVPNISLSLVEKIPRLKIERCFEDDECPLSCVLSYKDDDKAVYLFFEERKDKYGLFKEPGEWLGSSYKDCSLVMVKEIFAGSFPQLPTFRSYLFYKMPQKKTWRRRLCVLRNSGLYVYRQSKNTDSTNMQLLVSLYPSLHLYTTTGGWSADKSPTPYGFCLKSYGEQNPKFISYFCALSESGLRYWSSLFRIAMKGKTLLKNYENQENFVKETYDSLKQQNCESKLLPELSKSIGCVTGRYDLKTTHF